jgi:uncharacterized protein (TIGR03085 family)
VNSDAPGSWAGAERAALLDRMAALGPDAPTLIDPWTTHDLAAHLVVRERRPQALPGLVLPPLHAVTAGLERRMRHVPFDELLKRLRGGPPVWSPGGALRGPLEGITDLHEMYVHHEDVRRVSEPSPRELPDGLQDALWSRVRAMAPLLTARARGLRVVTETPDGRRATARLGRHLVVVRGTPGELLLWLFGRRAVARVELVGTPPAVEKARSARLGL